MKRAAAVLIIKDGLILGISRKNDPSKFGLVGGKCDENEHPVQTAQRECMEETGIEIHSGREIFVREEPADFMCARCGIRNPLSEDCSLGQTHDLKKGEDFYTHCFYALAWEGNPKSLEGTEVKWITASELTSSEMGAFPDYNSKTLEVFRKLYPSIELK